MTETKTIADTAEEKLLSAWLYLSLTVRGNRVLSGLTLNEAAICHFLDISDSAGLTASQLCDATKLLKSQMNRELNALESRGAIERNADPFDKRRILIRLTNQGRLDYYKEHSRVLRIFQAINDDLGDEEMARLAKNLHRATQVADKIIQEEF